MKRKTLRGDVVATPEKASTLLRIARAEVGALRGDKTPAERAKLRQAANKAWMALSAAADAFLCETEGRTAKSRADVARAFSSVGSEAAGNVDVVYNHLHIDCGYEDRPTCNIASVETGFRLAGQALHALQRQLAARRKRGAASKKCEPWPTTK